MGWSHVLVGGALACALVACSCASLEGFSRVDEVPDASSTPVDGSSVDGSSGGASDGSNGGGDSGGPVDAGDEETGGPLSYRDTVLADAPLGYWRLDETSGLVMDLGSAKQNGVIGAQVTRGVAGAIAGNAAIHNDGTAPAVVFSDAFDFAGNAPFSLEAWMNTELVDGEYRALCGKKQSSTTGYSLWVNQNEGLGFGRYTGGDAGLQDAIIAAVPSGWTYVVATYDGTVMKLYINATIAATSTEPNLSIPDRTNGFAIGAKGSDSPSYFKGDLDEIAVYDHALDPARIAAHLAAANR